MLSLHLFWQGRGTMYKPGVMMIKAEILDARSLTLTLLIPSYFGPALYTKRGVIWTPYYLINTWLYKPQILQGIRDTLQSLRKHKVCKKPFVWLPWQLFDNMVLFANNCQNEYEKQVFFKCSQKPQIKRC